MTDIVPGLFSVVGNQTEFEVSGLRNAAGVDGPDGSPAPQATLRKPKRKVTVSYSEVKPKGVREPSGELQKAVQERVRLSAQFLTERRPREEARRDSGRDASPAKAPRPSSTGAAATRAPRPSACFSSQGFYTGVWATRFTAGLSQGEQNRWNEERPPALWYKNQADNVRMRQPAVNMDKRKPHVSRKHLVLQRDDEAEALRYGLEYDADVADRYVAHRRDVARPFAGMSPRGRAAVQGVRALQQDAAVRGAAGMGFIPTCLDGESVETLEARAVDATKSRPDIGPVFDHTTQFQPTLMHNNFNHGHAPVHGASDVRFWGPKLSPLRKYAAQPMGAAAFERRASAPGFTARTHGLGGARVPAKSRSFQAMPNWQSEVRYAL